MPSTIDEIPDSRMVAKFAAAYGADEAMLTAAGENRHTVVLRPWRIVANPPAGA